MALTKKSIILIFIFSVISLLLGVIFKGNVTGFAVFSTEVLNYPLYDYLIIIVFVIAVVSSLVMHFIMKIEKEIEQDLKKFNVDKPNISLENLQKYISHCLSQGKDENRIKNVLISQGWDETIINESFENMKPVNY